MSKKMNLAVCDDDISVLGVVSGAISSAFAKHGIEVTVDVFRRALDLEIRMKERDYTLIFLDIDMPGMDGITFAKKLRASNCTTDIIFISSREDKVFEALRTNPGGFVRKSRFLEDVSEIVDLWLKNRPKEETKKLVIQNKEATYTFLLDSILYIESSGKTQEIHAANRSEPVVIRRSMQDLEDSLTPCGFLRIHKGYLVNYKFIRRLEEDEAVLTNGERIPLSRRRVQEVRNQYLELMQSSNSLIM